MKLFREIFTGANDRLSSKRVIGTICIGYSMLLIVSAMFFSATGTIPDNVLQASNEFLWVGGAMVAAGTFEKRILQ